MKRWPLGLLIGVVFALTGCGQRQISQVTLQERGLSNPNPTAYELDASVSDVTNALVKAFGGEWRVDEEKKNRSRVWKGSGSENAKRLLSKVLQLRPADLLWKGDADALAKDLLTKSGNENDAYLYGEGAPVGESQVYFKDGQPLIYFADFHIHLTAVGPRKTRVQIFTYDSNVALGLDERWSAHGPRLFRVGVAPTTVEEYQILLRIGERLGAKDMPPLVTPSPNSPVMQITKPVE